MRSLLCLSHLYIFTEMRLSDHSRAQVLISRTYKKSWRGCSGEEKKKKSQKTELRDLILSSLYWLWDFLKASQRTYLFTWNRNNKTHIVTPLWRLNATLAKLPTKQRPWSIPVDTQQTLAGWKSSLSYQNKASSICLGLSLAKRERNMLVTCEDFVIPN